MFAQREDSSSLDMNLVSDTYMYIWNDYNSMVKLIHNVSPGEGIHIGTKRFFKLGTFCNMEAAIL